MKVVLDTNVLVSATFWKGNSFRIVDLIDKKKITCFMSKETIAEYSKTINSDEIIEKIENKNLIVSKVIQKIITMANLVEPKRKIIVVKEDPDDNKFIEVAVESNANFIVSQDKHLLNLNEFEGIKIITPTQFLSEYSTKVEKDEV